MPKVELVDARHQFLPGPRRYHGRAAIQVIQGLARLAPDVAPPGRVPIPKRGTLHAQEVAKGRAASPQHTWSEVCNRLTDSVKFGFRPEACDSAANANMEEFGQGTHLTLVNIDESIDALLEEEICTDEASWLDITDDVQQVKNQIVQMIFADLVEEVVDDIRSMWSEP
jgi:hypothetical protein